MEEAYVYEFYGFTFSAFAVEQIVWEKDVH